MPRRGENIYKRKDGRWEARYVKEISPDGKKKYGSVYANSYREVKAKQQHLSSLPPPRQSQSALSVSDLMQFWLEHTRVQVKHSTYLKYESLIHNHILPQLGTYPLSSITRETVHWFAEKLQNNGRVGGGSLSGKTVNDILVILKLAFHFAEDEYSITLPRVTFFRDEKKEARVITPEEQDRLVSFLLADIDIFKFGVLLALYTGLRVGELCALQWEDISSTCIRVNKTMQRLKGPAGKTEIQINAPKSASSNRIIPLPRFLLPYIDLFRKTSGYVLQTERNMFTEPRAMQYKFEKMITQCGMRGVTFHTLRHTFATRCVEAGFDTKSLSEILGHADVKTTLNRYVHSSFQQKLSNMEKLSLPAAI